ncbi:NAD-dependent epimerase/dehydratase family protein [Neobacillus citreus]|uniref:NAD-dependent epimerase/dehydratase family protein n=1 Tax=Neobacillus citreus TaxID=2833578 RepID=A0A942T1I8_9BACI|nr:NAD-dependent epimerase/dehydratase family protein [Neobacillus citreus]MCH6266010.1 NAD-dependent epimerase/dehydratase family protein [Neobacillus citreus]
MNILITGDKGFIGRNLIEALESFQNIHIFRWNRDTNPELLDSYLKKCDFIFHLAAVHRPIDESEFEKVNHIFFDNILNILRKHNNNCPILLASTIHAESANTPYARSKIAAERALLTHADIMNSRAIIYRLTNTFGKYALPNYHSVVATFCYNAINNLPLVISNPDHVMNFYYIEDLVSSFISHIHNIISPEQNGFYSLPKELEYKVTVKELAQKIKDFKFKDKDEVREMLTDEFSKKLYKTYISYLETLAMK